MSLRLDSQVRLRARGEFVLVQKQGRRVATTNMTVLALPNSSDRDRIGIIASKKLGGAVMRNRAKRRLRALFRQLEPDEVQARGSLPLDLVVIPRRELVSAPFTTLEAEFTSALCRFDRTRRR
jgi:ribonuclease P protein component